MTTNFEDGDWRQIAEATSKEMNPEKFAILVAHLSRALDEHEKGLGLRRHQENQN